MKYPYMVVRNGVKYRAGEEVPDENAPEIVKEETKQTATPVELSPEQKSAIVFEEFDAKVAEDNEESKEVPEVPFADPVEVAEKYKKDYKPQPKYNKNTINRMPVMELRAVAKEAGIKDVTNKTGAQLKRELIEIYGL